MLHLLGQVGILHADKGQKSGTFGFNAYMFIRFYYQKFIDIQNNFAKTN